MGAGRRRRHRRPRHAARGARVLQPRGALGHRARRGAQGARGLKRRACAAREALRIVALGHRMPAWVDAGCADYAKRLPRDCALELVELKPEPRDRGKHGARSCSRPRRCASRAACDGCAHRRARRARRSRGRRASSPTGSRAGATTRATSRSSSAAPTASTPAFKRDAAARVCAVRADAAARRSCASCWPSSCTARRASSPGIPIIASDCARVEEPPS